LRRLRSRRGVNLIDVMITLFLVGVIGVFFSATFPFGLSSSGQAEQYKLATSIAQRKMEQLRALKYESLTQPILQQTEIIDADSTTLPYSFSTVDNVPSKLPEGVGFVSITDEDISRGIKRVEVTVKWSHTSDKTRSVVLKTLFSEKRPTSGS
jgi:type II secretory pathway pseudopilin PulG